MADTTLPRPDLPDDAAVPARIGPFRLLERIGSGGMGVVYLAERREPIEQKAALKVIRTDRLDRVYRARFRMEQSALARMDHPHIARLLDAGEDGGLAWFAMEHVPGVPLGDFCRLHRLSLEARLTLFSQVCDAVQHAHGKGILHRDLKPGNILVREVDGRPFAKVIDFGLARPIDPLQVQATLHESLRQVVGTIAYMSPEQAQRTDGDLDIRTDVYSLGVVLYELLTGELPLDLDEVERRGLPWLGELLREHEPEKPSTRLSALGQRLTEAAAERSASPGRLQARVRGELDWITMQALARERERRYETVRDLGRDVERWLRDEPVAAAPPGGWYVVRKWLRRHAWGVGVGAGVTLLLAVAGGIAATFAAEARAAEQWQIDHALARQAIDLVEQARHELWPATSEIAPRLDDWLEQSKRCQAAAPRLRELVAGLGMGIAAAASPAERVVLVARREDLTKCLRAIDGLPDLDRRVVARRDWALQQPARTWSNHRDLWEAVERELAADGRFRGLDHRALAGLVPLGRNHTTGYHEFYLQGTPQMRELPTRTADDGYEVDAFTGLIFVLLPGGEFTAPVEGRAGRGSRRLEPFLLSRYEMTQAQWARMTGEGVTSPAELLPCAEGNDPGNLQRVAGGPGAPLVTRADATFDAPLWSHPVQQVSWEMATRSLRRWNLGLPTVAQWWWAASGGESSAPDFSWTGADVGGFVNFHDEARVLFRGGQPLPVGFRSPSASWDGFVHTCPVNALRGNPKGFVSMFGNVAELTLDGYGEPWPPAAGSGPDAAGYSASETLRTMAMGGSFDVPFELSKALTGHQQPIANIDDTVGIRPVFLYVRREQ